jgi:tetrahydromethanopterin S-methyltransferase subunit G
MSDNKRDPEKELKDIRPPEISIVDYGANDEEYFVVKRSDKMEGQTGEELVQKDEEGRVFESVEKTEVKTDEVEEVKKETVDQKETDDSSEKTDDSSEKTEVEKVMPAAAYKVLTSVGKNILSLAKAVEQKDDGWPSNFASTISKAIKDLNALVAKSDSSPVSKNDTDDDESKEEVEKADQKSVAKKLMTLSESATSLAKECKDKIPANFNASISKLVSGLKALMGSEGKYPSPKSNVTKSEESNEEVDKRGSKISANRLSKLQKMQSELTKLGRTFNNTLKEFGSFMSELQGSKVSKSEPDTSADEKSTEEEVDKSTLSTDDIKVLKDTLDSISKRLETVESDVTKFQRQRVTSKDAGANKTTKVEKKEDPSSFVNILGLPGLK